MTLSVNSLLCHQRYAFFDLWMRLESRVALYLSYLHITFDGEIKGASLRISSIRPDSPVSKVKLAFRFGFICSHISQLLKFVTQIYGNQRTCDK